MNDSALTELKIHVERAVRPLWVGLSRKRLMREELLSHLVSIYDEEFAKLGDEQKAVEQARLRFGGSKEITAELQESVSRQDRLCYWMDRLRLEPGESLLHLVGKHLLLACIVYGVLSLLVILILMDRGQIAELGVALRVFAVMGLVMSLFGSLFVWMSRRISRALHGSDAERSRTVVIRFCLAALLTFPLTMVVMCWGLGHLSPPPSALWTSGITSPLAPLALILMSRQAADEMRHDEEWAVLEIEM